MGSAPVSAQRPGRVELARATLMSSNVLRALDRLAESGVTVTIRGMEAAARGAAAEPTHTR